VGQLRPVRAILVLLDQPRQGAVPVDGLDRLPAAPLVDFGVDLLGQSDRGIEILAQRTRLEARLVQPFGRLPVVQDVTALLLLPDEMPHFDAIDLHGQPSAFAVRCC
jgi:hypothetical protein